MAFTIHHDIDCPSFSSIWFRFFHDLKITIYGSRLHSLLRHGPGGVHLYTIALEKAFCFHLLPSVKLWDRGRVVLIGWGVSGRTYS